MTKMEFEEKLKGIEEKEKFLEEAKSADSPERIVEMLSNYGIKITIEELENDILPYITNQEEAELSEEDLDNVNGGKWKGLVYYFEQFLDWLLEQTRK